MIASDAPEIAAFWDRACKATGIDPASPYHARTFSDPSLSTTKGNTLTELCRAGKKRGTAHMALDFEKNGIPRREVGDYWLVLTRELAPACVVRVSGIETRPFKEVSVEFAVSEGEGDLSYAYWAKAHSTYFKCQLESWGMEWRDDVATVCESFRLIYAE